MIDGLKSKRVIMSLLLFAAVVLCSVGDIRGAETGPSEPFDPTWTPEVVYDDNPGLVEFYWKAWDLAWDHVHWDNTAPTSPFMDEAFENGRIWIWDTCFMGLFCKYAPDRFPGVQSFENFYKVFHDGITSSQTIWHPDNPPLFAWVEWQNYKFTNDLSRLQWLLVDTQYLQKHFAFFENSVWGQSIPGAANGMALERSPDDIGYWWRGVSSGMDNSPRDRNFTVYWIDAISQQALSAYYISKMAEEIGNTAIRDEYLVHYNSFVNLINTHYWDSQDNFYYDIKEYTHEFSNIKTMASYWPLLAEVADATQAQHMAGYASDPQVFGGTVTFPALAHNDQDFDPTGKYWRGGMWLPTAYMGVKSLENYGFQEEADAAARSIVNHMCDTFISYSPATIWECYSPTEAKPATLVSGTGESRPDFCGWSALGPISLFIENYLGFHTVDAQANRVEWRKYQTGRHGIRKLKFGTITTHIMGNSDSFTVWSSGPYTLAVNGTDYAIAAGEQSWGTNPPTLEGTPGTWPQMNVNLALNKTADMTPGSAYGTTPADAIDGSLSTYAQSATPVWDLSIDLQDVNEINTITFVPHADSWASEFTIQVSTDNVNWQTVVTETSGGNTDETYTFTPVNARYILLDVTAVGHTGSWGHAVSEFEVYNLNDTVLPTPDPMTWSVEPYAVDTTSISMTATGAYDQSGVEYYFTCTAGGGHDSSWQDSPSYTDTGLTANTQYTYTVKCRDKSPNQNETAASSSVSAVTPSVTVIATDDFNYADGALAGNNGGIGWAGPWTDNAGTPATVVGGVAQTSFTSGGSSASSQVQRDLNSTLTSAWIRATVHKTATVGVSDSFGGIGLFDGGTERGLIGNFWPGVAVDAWGAGTNGSQGEIAGELVTTLSDVIVYIDGTETKLWVNPADPANLGTPDATGGGVGQFNRIILRCGTSTAGTATWQFDDLIIGETLSDITPPPCAGIKFDGDIDGDCFADITDLLLLVQEWMSVSVVTDADINEDTKVNFSDFSYIGRDWLTLITP